MSITGTYTLGAPVITATSGGGLTATQTITYALTGDGAATSFSQDTLIAGAAQFGMGLPVSVTATITRQQISGTPPAWVAGKVYALNTQIGAANGTIHQVTTAGTSLSGVWTANTTYTTNQQVFDPYGNIQTATVGGMTGTSLPSNFTPNMGSGVITQDNGVTWTCGGNVYPAFSATPTQTTADNSVVWTCEGTNSVTPTYDAPIITPTLSGSVLTLSFNEALKAPGATNTDAYGTVFTYTTWAVVATLHYSASAVSSVPVTATTATWNSSTAINTNLPMNINGAATVTVAFTVTGTITSGGLVQCQVSVDNVNWFPIQFTTTAVFGVSSSWAPSVGNFIAVADVAGFAYFRTILGSAIVGSGSFTVTQQTSSLSSQALVTVGQSNAGALLATVAQSGTWTVGVSAAQTIAVTQATAANLNATVVKGTAASLNATVVGTTLTKGTQGAAGFSVQELKDAGRNYVSFTATAAAGVTAEALLSLSQNKQGTVTAGVTSYTVTSGKTLRVTSISVSVKSAAAAIAFARLSLRHNTAGATIATSPVAYLIPEVNTNSATSGTSAWITVDIPDGIEFFGNGTQTIGLSHLDQATTNVLNVTVYGFEY